ncbi:MAG: zinc-ribbon domain-containing protein [Ruminococcus sp.]|nr:zinc-ribbon domain-containing protein [Ruminococcus sp.]
MTKFCTKCGTEVPMDATVCPSCGAALKSALNAEQVRYQSSNEGQANAQQAAPNSGYSQQTSPNQTYYAQPNNVYQQAAVPMYQPLPIEDKHTGILGWIGWLLLCSILPVIGQIIAICASSDKSVKNYAAANLILAAVVAVITIACFAVFGLAVTDVVSQL